MNDTCLAYHPSKPNPIDGQKYIPGQYNTIVREGPLKLGHWSLLVSSVVMTNNNRQLDYVDLAVLPSDRPRHERNAQNPNAGEGVLLETKHWAEYALGEKPPFPLNQQMWVGPKARPSD